MDFLGAALSSVASILFLTMVVAGVYKLFQVASLLSDTKDLLADIKRNTNPHSLAVPMSSPAYSSHQASSSMSSPMSSPMSSMEADNLLRAVSELDHPVPPAVVDVEHHVEHNVEHPR